MVLIIKIAYEVAVGLLQVYAAYNSDAWAANFQTYLLEEFLGGLPEGPCKYHTATWFSDIGAGETWAVYSNIITLFFYDFFQR